MAKQSSKKPSNLDPTATTSVELRKSLNRQSKAILVDAIMELAHDRGILRELITKFDVSTSPKELIAATEQAITDATAYDSRQMNRNFNYDSLAYDEVKRNLTQLVVSGDLRNAMQLSLKLMKRGSEQVEMSDEGLMTEEIEDCIIVVIKSLKTGALPKADIVAWCTSMREADRVGFIADKELKALREKFASHEGKKKP